MNPTVTTDLNLLLLDTITLSVRKIIKYCGKSSGISIEVRDLNKRLSTTDQCMASADKTSVGWYEVSRVF